MSYILGFMKLIASFTIYVINNLYSMSLQQLLFNRNFAKSLLKRLDWVFLGACECKCIMNLALSLKLQRFFSTNFHLFNLFLLFNAANIFSCLNGEFVSCMGRQETKRWSSDSEKECDRSPEPHPQHLTFTHTNTYMHIYRPA